MTTPEESHFDEELRRRLADFEAAPPSEAWSALQNKLPAPPAKPGLGTRLRPFGAGVIVGALLWWGGAHWAVTSPESGAAPAVSVTRTVPSAPAEPSPAAVVAPATTALLPSATISTSPATVSGLPATISTSPATVSGLPATTPTAPATVSGLPATTPTAPATISGSPTTISGLPATIPGSPATISGLPATIAVSTDVEPVPSQPSAGETGLTLLSPGVRHIVTLDTAIRRTLTATDAARDARLRALLAEQTLALAALQHGLDSLKQALPEAPPALAINTLPSDTPATQSDWHTLPPARSPWAMIALLETTPHWSVLPTQGTTAAEEQTQASLAQSLQVQRQFGNNWRLRGGFGQATLQTQGRYTSDKSGVKDLIDSTITSVYEYHTGRDSTYIVREDSVAINEPILNSSGQIVGYNTTWASTNDTIWSIIVSHDTLETKQVVVTKRTETWRERHQQLLRPEYRFWTIPFSAQYLLVNRNRWSLGLSVGAQAVIFRGGSRPVWNGDEYVLQRVGPRDGPYRPVSFSVSTGLEAQYRFSPRLSILAAPTLRWWAVPATKGPRSTMRTLLPAAQVGISYGF